MNSDALRTDPIQQHQTNRNCASIIIPAHNEARTLDRLLGQLADLKTEHDIVVVANGCTDRTADVARSHSWCRVIELPVASKVAALNAGDAAVQAFPRIYLDADVSVNPDTLRALVQELDRDTPLVASPSVSIDDKGASLLSRAYQQVWAQTDYRLKRHTGSGLFGLSREGRARFELFPEIIADDLYVRRLFAEHERRVSPGAPFTIYAPRSIRAQVGRLRRTMAGEIELTKKFPALAPQEADTGARGRLLRRIARQPKIWPAFLVYAAAYAAGRIGAHRKLATGRGHIWNRDLTTR